MRNSIQRLRDNIPAKIRREKSRIISNKFFKLPEYKTADTILLYYPFRSEPDTSIIIKRAISEGKKVALPKISGTALKLYYINDTLKQLKPGAYGIMEPDEESCVKAHPEDIDIVLVPGVCFDKQLNRIGYGGGFYDRLLPGISPGAKKISVCFQVQLVDKIPSAGHDVPVDMIITEENIYK
ncbi:MAG: putative 5-formyltetrahydrofolate cyclo-ligase [Actinobacteria bacterium ADurb.Bin346]|nr:MAG: putative 5-formyltetrahydrofolate cyclo-ligase [Actinobacteria bacterium ADurb.Bin346]